MEENKYLVKIAQMIKVKEPPRSERAAKKPRKVKKPKLHKFTAKIGHKHYK